MFSIYLKWKSFIRTVMGNCHLSTVIKWYIYKKVNVWVQDDCVQISYEELWRYCTAWKNIEIHLNCFFSSPIGEGHESVC